MPGTDLPGLIVSSSRSSQVAIHDAVESALSRFGLLISVAMAAGRPHSVARSCRQGLFLTSLICQNAAVTCSRCSSSSAAWSLGMLFLMLLTHAVTACGVVDFGAEVFKYLLDMSGSDADSPVSFLFLEGVSICFVGVIGMTFLGVS